MSGVPSLPSSGSTASRWLAWVGMTVVGIALVLGGWTAAELSNHNARIAVLESEIHGVSSRLVTIEAKLDRIILGEVKR